MELSQKGASGSAQFARRFIERHCASANGDLFPTFRSTFAGQNARTIRNRQRRLISQVRCRTAQHATQCEFSYRHQWQVVDMVMWDNTATVPRGRWFDFAERRGPRRATTEA